jgi:hypothetical protein
MALMSTRGKRCRDAERILGWRPTMKFEELVKIMVDADLHGIKNFKEQAGAQ